MIPETLTVKGRRPQVKHNGRHGWYVSSVGGFDSYLGHDGRWHASADDGYWPTEALALDAIYLAADLPPGWHITKIGDWFQTSATDCDGLGVFGERFATPAEAYAAAWSAAQPGAPQPRRCPECGSTRVFSDFDRDAGKWYECENCERQWGEPQPAAPPSEPSGWRPIESAPKDGRSILIGWAGADMVFVSRWFKNAERWAMPSTSVALNPPTHWQPLPAAPSETGAKQ